MKAPITRAAFGIAALVAIAILANWLISLTPLGNRGADFTENKIHTLSEGTEAILEELDTPVVVRFYATRNSDYMPEQLKVHMRRVDDLLKEYSNLAGGELRVENLDPQPDTDAEDSANLDGVTGQRINNDNIYLGLAVSALDKKVVLPFLDPADETMLEYQISKAIAEVTTPVKPVIGIMSALDLAGTPAMMPGQQPQQPWVIYQQLQQAFDLKDLGMTPEKIDPDEIKALLLFHPAGITPETEYLIDQYILGGGTVVACLDAYSLAAQMTGGGNPMTGQQGAPATSDLPTLLPAWGINFTSDQVLADPIHATQLDGGRKGIAVLSLPQSAMPQEDNIVTKGLESVTFYLAGAFKRTGGGGVASNSLIRSSSNAGFVDPMKASRLDPSLDTGLRSEGTAFDLVTFLSGNFKTAFPDGKPETEPAAEAPAEEESAETEDAEEDSEPSLKKAAKPGNVFLIADVDAFYDHFAYRVQNFGGMQMAAPANGNATLLLNILDQAVGSKYLIGSRSRAATRRPFTVIREMEIEFDKKVGDKIEEFQAKQEAAQTRLQELQAQKARGTELYLSPEQEAEIEKLRKEQVEYARLVREQQKDLRRQKDKLAGKITLLNVAAMPALVILFGLLLYLVRRSSTRAR